MYYAKLIILGVITIALSFSLLHANPSNKALLQTYGCKDLSQIPAFQGGFINFGYWKGIFPKTGEITRQERIQASEALYNLTIQYLDINSEDSVLEVGSGRGLGCRKIAEANKPIQITGMDITPEQVTRARIMHQAYMSQNPSLSFTVGSSDCLPFADGSLTKIFSVEAAQCFPSMRNFAKEAWRVLKPGGRLVITAHFATDANGYRALRALIPTVDQDVDRLIPIQDVRQAFREYGFTEVSFEDIGTNIFEGYESWRSNVEDSAWGSNIYLSYKNNYMGYFLLVLRK